MRHTTVLVTAAAIVSAVAGTAAAMWRSRERPIDVSVVAAGVAGAATAGFLALVVLGPMRLGFFGLFHLAYVGVVVTLPLLGMALLAFTLARRVRGWPLAMAAVLVVPAPIGFYATHVEPYWLRVDTFTVPVDPARAGDDRVRIGVLADLETNDVGPHERSAIDKLLAAKPDVILMPGDLFQGRDDEFDPELPKLRAELARLEAPAGVYFVRGDVDLGARADRALTGTRVVIVDDRVVDVPVGDRLIRLGGNRLDYKTAAAAEVRRELDSSPEDGTIRIVLSHRPDPVLELPARSRVDLTVAGHTHGGQVVIPGWGPPVTFSDVPRSVARGGLHKVRGNRIYVSPGVGLERSSAPQLRLFNRPAIALLDVKG